MNLRELAVAFSELITKKGRLAELCKEEEQLAERKHEPLPTPGSLTRARALYLLEELFQMIETTLSEGEEIRIVKFGIFRSERIVRSGSFNDGQVTAVEPARRLGFFFAPNPYARLRIKEARQNPKNPYLPVLQRDPAAFAKLTGRCPTCNEVLPTKLPLRCVRCGATPFERKP